MSDAAWSREEFEAQLRTQGRAYHIHHPFNVLMNSGAATPAQIRGWVANRFYYQINIPIKDAAILSNCTDRAVRRSWAFAEAASFAMGGRTRTRSRMRSGWRRSSAPAR